MSARYIVPDSPDDPEAAALDLLVQMPVDLLGHQFLEVMQDFAGVLHVEGALTGLPWCDAKPIAVAVAFDITSRDDAGDFLRHRAHNARCGADGMGWADRDTAARAFTIAASVFDQ